MPYKVEFHPQVYEDLDQAIKYYNSQVTDLGFQFYQNFLKSLKILEANPLMFQQIYKSNRRVILKKFPFSIIYEINEPSHIIIKAVFHHSRNPKDWQ